MADHRVKASTYRVENIPPGTSKEELLERYFYREDREDIKVKSLCPSCDSVDPDEDDWTATIFYRPRDADRGELRLANDDTLTLSKEFFGFTPLYVPPKEKGPVAADIIAVTGLGDHAFGSWSHSDERMWLRDYLPKDAPNARILTYGYKSALQGDSISLLEDHTNKFVHKLVDMRDASECESRPIIFVGHSLGCLIIKKALTGIGPMGIPTSRLPVRAVIFLAAPHRGLNIDALQTLLMGQATEAMINELRADSPILRDLTSRFRDIVEDNVDLLTCYEQRPTKTVVKGADGIWRREGPPVIMVGSISARLDYRKEKCVSVDCDHSQIAKLKKGEGGIYPTVKSAIKHGLISTARIVAGKDVSLEYPRGGKELTNGGSGSMTGYIHAVPPPYFQDKIATSHATYIPQQPQQPPPALAPHPDRHMAVERATTPTYGNASHYIRPKVQASPPAHDRGNSHAIESRCLSEAHGKADEIVNVVPDISTLTISEPPEAPVFLDKSEVTVEEDMDDVYEVDPDNILTTAICSRCDEGVPDSTFHYYCYMAINNQYGEDDDKDRVEEHKNTTVCQSCAYLDPNCEIRKEILVKRGVKPHKALEPFLPYIETEILRSDNSLIRAVKENDLDKIGRLSNNPKLLSGKAYGGCTPLVLAVQLGLVDAVKIMLDNGASPAERDSTGLTPLFMAVQYNRYKVAKLLLDAGADVEDTGGQSSALHLAASNGRPRMLQLLLNRQAPVDVSFPGFGTPLSQAAQLGSNECVKILLAAGADPNAMAKSGATPLKWAALKGYGDVVKTLLRNKAIASHIGTDGETPIYCAVDGGHGDICGDLIDAGADFISEVARPVMTPLGHAARLGRRNIVKVLLARGAPVDGISDENTPLGSAAVEGHLDVCRDLIEAGANLNATYGPLSTSPVGFAAKFGYEEIAELLLSRGARVDINDSSGHPPIYVAVVTEHVKVCQLLLAFGADARFKTVDTERTVLAITTIDGNLSMVKLLIEYHADLDDADTYGWTPIGHAAFKGFIDICRVLIDAGANLDLLVSGKTALTEAARAGHSEIVEMLLAGGAWVMPPPAYKGKWKNLEFKSGVTPWKREEILRTLRAAKHM
ncbi:hypothetical protein VC83_08432 [Pseudogymnoascus destructans]|uniref:Uncharacterized protein n=2 Tax=Pseudogymnoascus destructans TaxID=655981 RepID=L8FP81_PSED2|nr:uncharacterized protein VC83_08432 [Pseudogymnoascus destructans]ELR02697.1 hypothetical protein GMDG_05646 [Pseudogymnoascus destructans 20631-21]OAF55100.1 hypothetical protein VC83_08432 [Pseudogymnoascus destructans]